MDRQGAIPAGPPVLWKKNFFSTELLQNKIEKLVDFCSPLSISLTFHGMYNVTWFHASPKPNLHEKGIDPNAQPLVSRRVQGWVYFGSRGYLFEQYFNYAPKRRKYYVYKINIEGLPIDNTPLAGEQIRTAQFVDASRVELVEVVKPSG